MNKKVKSILLGTSVLFILFFLSSCTFTQFIAHYANMDGWTTKINIQNPYSKDVDVTLYVYDDDGNLITNEKVTVPAHGFYKAYVEDIFTDTIPDTGSIRMVSEEDPSTIQKVSAIILFEYDGDNGTSMGGLQSFSHPEKVLNFPWFQNSSDFHTGIAILNVNGWPIQVVMKATESDGTIHLSNTQTLNPMQRIIGYPSDFFPEALPENCDLSVEASGNIAGFIILHNSTVSKVEAINGVPVVPFEPDFFALENTSLDLNTRPISMISSTNGNKLFVAVEYPTEKVLVIDTMNYSIIHEIDFNRVGPGMALSPDGKNLFVADFGDNLVYRIDTTTYNKYQYTTTFNLVHYTAISTDGRYFAAASSTNYIVWDLANSGNTIINSTAGDIWGCIFTEDSKNFLVIDKDNSTLIATEVANPSNVTTVNLSGHPKCIVQAPDNGLIYVGNDNDKIDEISNTSFNITKTLTTGSSHYSMAFSPDGRYLYAPSLSDEKLWIFDEYANDFKDPIDLGDTVICVGASSNGDYVYYALNTSPYTLRAIEGLPLSVSKKK